MLGQEQDEFNREFSAAFKQGKLFFGIVATLVVLFFGIMIVAAVIGVIALAGVL